MYIKINDPDFKKKIKAFLMNGPAVSYGSATQMIGPTIVAYDDERKVLLLYGTDFTGSGTLFSYAEISAEANGATEPVFVPDFRTFADTLDTMDYECDIEFTDDGYVLSNDRLNVSQTFDFGEAPDILANFMAIYECPDKLGKHAYVHVFTVNGRDLAKLQSLNKKTAREDAYVFSDGSIATSTSQLTVDPVGSMQPHTVVGVDPILYAAKSLGQVKVYVIDEPLSIEFHSPLCTYVFIEAGDE